MRILIFIWCGFGCGSWFLFDADVDPDPTSPWFGSGSGFELPKKGSNAWKECSNRLIFHTFWLVICKLMRIRIRVLKMMRIHADPDLDSQHWFLPCVYPRFTRDSEFWTCFGPGWWNIAFFRKPRDETSRYILARWNHQTAWSKYLVVSKRRSFYTRNKTMHTGSPVQCV